MIEEDDSVRFAFMVEKFTDFVQGAYAKDLIDEFNYERMSRWEIETLEDAQMAYDELAHCQKEHDIKKRMVMGAELIAKETDPRRKQRYEQRYRQLSEELENLKGA